MAKSKKIVIAVVTLILAVAVIYFSRWLIRYYFYNDYRESLSSYEYEEGSAFQALADSGKEVAGMELAAENDTLKLYADMETAEVAIVDKRNGQITYSNPQDADDDAIASTTNKNYLKSQSILDFSIHHAQRELSIPLVTVRQEDSLKRNRFKMEFGLSIHWAIWRVRQGLYHNILAGRHLTEYLPL